jgi:uncharacterized protein (DUF1800 family)
VDGGYTQKDVTEAARVLTGWGVQGFGYNSAPVPVQFKFKPYHHDAGEKTVMGRKFGPGGVEEGVQLIDFLASHPSTARFISTKLCRRFVADDPPAELVKRVAERFQAAGGDIRETLGTLFDSPEFFAPVHYKAKVKTPLEYVVSSLRSAGTSIVGWNDLIWQMHGMAQPLYYCEPPTGYPDTAKAWLGSGPLLARINFTSQLFDRPYGGHYRTDIDRLVGKAAFNDGKAVLDNMIESLLLGEISDTTRQSLEKQLEIPAISDVALAGRRRGVDAKKVAALVLASPDFQRR